MKDWQSQAHIKWECTYHVVIIPKYRRKMLYGKIRHDKMFRGVREKPSFVEGAQVIRAGPMPVQQVKI